MRKLDSNQRPSAHETDKLDHCYTPLDSGAKYRCCPATPSPKLGVLLLHYILHMYKAVFSANSIPKTLA